MKYHDTNGIAAFVGLRLALFFVLYVCNLGRPNSTDELQKSAAYMTEAYLLSRANSLRTPFEFAFGTDVGFFEWLEGEEAQEKTPGKGNHTRHRFISPHVNPVEIRLLTWLFTGRSRDEYGVEMGFGTVSPAALGKTADETGLGETAQDGNPNRYRLERFGKAMSGSVSWEVPAAVLNGMYCPFTGFDRRCRCIY